MRARLHVVLACACVVLAGCRHRQKPTPIVVPPLAQVPVEPVPEPGNPPKVATESAGPVPEASVTPPKPAKKARRKPTPPPAPAPAPAQVASTGTPPVPAADVIGALTTGGENTPDKRDKAAVMLAAQEKRLKELSAQAASEKRREVQRVRYFCTQAAAALKTGDADAALTLATKAKVLLDEIWK